MTNGEFKERKARASSMFYSMFHIDLDDLADCPYWDYFQANGGEFTISNLADFVASHDDLFAEIVAYEGIV